MKTTRTRPGPGGLTPHQPRTETIIPPRLSAPRTTHRAILVHPSIHPRQFPTLVEIEPMLEHDRISHRHFPRTRQFCLPAPLTLGEPRPPTRTVGVERHATLGGVLVTRVDRAAGEETDNGAFPVRGVTLRRFMTTSDGDGVVQVETVGERGRGGPRGMGGEAAGGEETVEHVGRVVAGFDEVWV